MKLFIPTCRQATLFFRFMVVIGWRRVRGNWYIFRDLPDWYVHVMAFPPVPDPHPEIDHITRLAREEWQLRKRQRNQRRQITATARATAQAQEPPDAPPAA